MRKKIKVKPKAKLDYKKVISFLSNRLDDAKVLYNNATQVTIISDYVDHFKTNPIEDYKSYISGILKVPKTAKNIKSKTNKKKFKFLGYNRPEWRNKRLEVFKRDKYTCRGCGSSKELRCHHSFYEYGRQVWEYPMSSFITFCDTCHNKFHKVVKGSELVVRKQ